MAENFGSALHMAIKENILEQIELVKIDENTYKHRNMVFDIKNHYTPKIYVFETDDLDKIKYHMNNKYTSDLTCLCVYDMKNVGVELPDFKPYWKIRGKWVDYLRSYFQNMEALAAKAKKDRMNAIREIGREIKKKREIELQEKIAKIEKFYD